MLFAIKLDLRAIKLDLHALLKVQYDRKKPYSVRYLLQLVAWYFYVRLADKVVGHARSGKLNLKLL